LRVGKLPPTSGSASNQLANTLPTSDFGPEYGARDLLPTNFQLPTLDQEVEMGILEVAGKVGMCLWVLEGDGALLLYWI
jgi:hypothetical protein